MSRTTSKRCLTLRVSDDDYNYVKCDSFAFETDADKVEFVDYFIENIQEFAKVIDEGSDLILGKYAYPADGGKRKWKTCIHLYLDYIYSSNIPARHDIFPCQTYAEKLLFATWVEKEMETFSNLFSEDHVRIDFGIITFPFDATSVSSFILDKTGEEGIVAAVVNAASNKVDE